MAESARGQAMSLTVLIAMYNSCEIKVRFSDDR